MIESEDSISVTQAEQELSRSLVQPAAPCRASCGVGPGCSGLCPRGCANPHRTCSAARSPATTTLPLQPQPLFPRPARCLLASHRAPMAVSPPLPPRGGGPLAAPSPISAWLNQPQPSAPGPGQLLWSGHPELAPVSFPPRGP